MIGSLGWIKKAFVRYGREDNGTISCLQVSYYVRFSCDTTLRTCHGTRSVVLRMYVPPWAPSFNALVDVHPTVIHYSW